MQELKKGIILLTLFLTCNLVKAQLTDGMTGLLHMVNAEVQKDATFMLGGNYLNKHNLPNNRWWGYDTYNYYLNITFLDRMEIAYICTLVQGKPGNGYHWPEYTYGKFVNQDRHFAGKIQLIKEGEWWKQAPSWSCRNSHAADIAWMWSWESTGQADKSWGSWRWQEEQPPSSWLSLAS